MGNLVLCSCFFIIMAPVSAIATRSVNFTLFEKRSTWDESNTTCILHGMKLLVLDTKQMSEAFNQVYYEWIKPYSTNKHQHWFGLVYDGTDTTCNGSTFSWVNNDQKHPNWTNWDTLEPNVCHIDKCVRVIENSHSTDLLWRTANCDNKYTFICYKVMMETTPIIATTSIITTISEITTELPTTQTSSTETATDTSPEPLTPPTSTDTSREPPPPTTMETTEIITRSSPQAYSENCCACPHQRIKEDKEEEIKKIIKELTVPKHTTMKYYRSKISATDERPSATALGSVIGSVVVSVVVVVIFVPDIFSLMRHLVYN